MDMRAFLGALVALGAMSADADAQVNVALGKPVSLVNPGEFGTGSGYFRGGNGVPALPAAGMVTDGVFQGGYWTTGVWWDEQNSQAHSYVVVDLQGTYAISAFTVMVDNNDRYLLEYRDPSSDTWSTAWQIPEVCCSGLMRRAELLTTPITADALRISGIFVNVPGHDYAFSVSEISTAYAPPSTLPPPPWWEPPPVVLPPPPIWEPPPIDWTPTVPEPANWSLLAAGAPALLLLARRSRRRER